jgi:hypothetical protein
MGPDRRRRKEYFEKTAIWEAMRYKSGMRMVPDRAVLTVGRHNGSWAVEFDGQLFGHSTDREVSKAAANKRARQIVDAGRACQVRVTGETGYFDGP